MRPALFTFRLANGSTWKGALRGAGTGPLSGLGSAAVVLRLLDRAQIGAPLLEAVEPIPGHVHGIRTETGAYERVDLRGAQLIGWDARVDDGGAR